MKRLAAQKRTRKTRNGRKSALTVIKEWLSEEDARTLLALIMVIGGILTIVVSMHYKCEVVVTPAICALIMLVLEWYFQAKREERR